MANLFSLSAVVFLSTLTISTSTDSAMLLVSALDGPMPSTVESLSLAQQIGITNLTPYLVDCDKIDDDELLELVEMEVRELLNKYDFDGDEVLVECTDIELEAGLYTLDLEELTSITSTTSASPTETQVLCPQDTKDCADGTILSRDPSNNCEFSGCAGDLCGTQANGDCAGIKAASFICPYDDKCKCYGNCGGCILDDNLACSPQIISQNDVCPSAGFCTFDVKQCADGTSVGRDGNNNCRFRECPKVKCTLNRDCDRKNGFKCLPNLECRVNCDVFGCNQNNKVCQQRDGECRSDADCDTQNGFLCEGIKRTEIGICGKYQLVNNGISGTSGFVIEIDAPWVVRIICIFGLILLCNIIFMSYINCIKTQKGGKRYRVVKHVDSEDFDEEEANPINVNK